MDLGLRRRHCASLRRGCRLRSNRPWCPSIPDPRRRRTTGPRPRPLRRADVGDGAPPHSTVDLDAGTAVLAVPPSAGQ
ncbi:DUF6191 domain-containing protein [Geodermatophilus sp. SYSU D00703]